MDRWINRPLPGRGRGPHLEPRKQGAAGCLGRTPRSPARRRAWRGDLRRSRGAPTGVGCEPAPPILPAQFVGGSPASDGAVRTPQLGSFLPAPGEGDKWGRGVSKDSDAGACGGRGHRGCAGKVLEPRMKSTRVCGRRARPGQEAVPGRWRLATEGVLHRPRVFGQTLCLGSRVEGRPADGAAPPRPGLQRVFFFFLAPFPLRPRFGSRASDYKPSGLR